jgi:hypothetical protein
MVATSSCTAKTVSAITIHMFAWWSPKWLAAASVSAAERLPQVSVITVVQSFLSWQEFQKKRQQVGIFYIFIHSREVKISLKQQIYFQMKLAHQKCASI